MQIFFDKNVFIYVSEGKILVRSLLVRIMQRILRDETEFLRGQLNEVTSVFGQTPSNSYPQESLSINTLQVL